MDNINNGLITKIWGPSLWIGLHCITFGYPVNPTEQQKKDYKIFFEKVGEVLPCKHCRESYKIFIKEQNTNIDYALENRNSLTKWLYDIHNKVNDKLGVEYGITYDMIKKKYESYRAKCVEKKADGCVVPLYSKKKCYQEIKKKDCPIIDYNTAYLFIDYAIERGINYKFFCFLNKDLKNNEKKWRKRNEYCDKIISYMRENNIPSIEESGKYTGLPTIFELQLILAMSTNLSKKELHNILLKLKNIYNKYK